MAEGKRILLVDDHEDTCDLLRMALELRGYVVRVAGTVRDGIDAAAEEQFDCLVSDLNLPDGTGRDLLEQVRTQGPLPAVALSGLSADDGPEADGFDERLVKPVSVEHLMEVIEHVTR